MCEPPAPGPVYSIVFYFIFLLKIMNMLSTPTQQKNLDMVVHPVIPATVESINRRITVQVGQNKMQDPIIKITRVKRAGGVTRAVDLLV
jgi:hypothetical protein